jgi:hypothetical protein
VALGALSDQEWLEIREAARLIPDDGARAEMDACLFVKYPGMTYNRERVAAALRRWTRMLKHLDAAAELYWQGLPHLPRDEFEAILERRACAWLPGDVTELDEKVEATADPADDPEAVLQEKDRGRLLTERDLHYIATLHSRALAHVLACQALRRGNRGKEDPQQVCLISWLCGIWLNYFHAPDLTFTVPPLGGEPRGPLIDFLRAAMSKVMTVPSPHTLRRAIERERAERENLRRRVIERERANQLSSL